ncbi:restriction endonuclease subunit S [Paenibacillus sp. LC231]|uniref:restriction endonuclease subunit S n=1 Tax=Paenibacillus sp. LC231 TaxID=1120679 RepID=UPI001914CC73|nr:restriction endonuclease subunit S [Paenibacillus sp. LC231]
MMTENNQNLVPEIRFNGFTNAWEQRKLGEILAEKISNGIMNQPGKNELNIRHINVVNLYSSSYIHLDELQYINATENDLKRCNVEVGDIFLTRSSLKVEGIAQANILLNEGTLVFDDHIMRIKLANGFEPFFVKESLNHSPIKREFMAKSKTGTMTTIGQDDIASSVISFPIKAEQTAIGNFFRTLDDTITLHKRKLDVLVTLKYGFLQQMFPAANEVMPRVRFAGFTGNWEERRLEEMLTERNEQFEESEDYPLMSFVGNVGVVPKGEQYDRSFLVKGDGKKYKKTELNDFIYSSNNLETGSIGLNRTGKAVISPVYSIFYSSNDSESLFVGLLSKRKDFINKMIHYRQGVMYGQWRIHERDFLKIIVLTPTISEQNRIIDFFKNFDEQIAAQTAKLEQLRQLKAAYLQRMFI